ncbi:MAG: hydrogenase small subunit [Mucispirillum sp.]|nr:hydrogenase small subunit [Mucispirillum sp.]
MIERSLLSAGYTRRDFMKAVTTATAIMGLPLAKAEEVIAAAGKEDKRPPVIWLHFQECTGCSEALLRANHPSIAEVVLDIINLEYQETLMAGSGDQAENSLHNAIKKHDGKYILVVEGSIPTGEFEVCCQIGGKTAYQSFKECASHAAAVVSLGACACSGGIVAIEPNPPTAKGAPAVMKELGLTQPLISLPGCPPNPYNILSVILYYATFGKWPELDSQNRPLFAYGRLIHEHCERRPHFDAGRFVRQFGDEGHREGWCLYHMGCKGPETYANCSIIHFNDGAAWPIGTGCPCIGCTEGDVLFKDSLFTLAKVSQPRPNSNVPTSQPKDRGKTVTMTQAAVVGGLVGAAAGAGAVFAGKLPKEPEDEGK